jgi:hypothetical protein
LYGAGQDGHAFAFKLVGGTWQITDLSNANTPLVTLAVGDGDNDFRHEVYVVGQNGHVYQFKDISIQPTPTVTPMATPLPPQKSFKILPSQINPNRSEQATICWTQPQSGAVSITIYTLNGDKVISLVDNKNYSAGQYNEVKWNGRNQDGAAVGSGIYIVLFKGPGYQEIGKAAVLK